MKRFTSFLAALVCMLLVVPLAYAAGAAAGAPDDLFAGLQALYGTIMVEAAPGAVLAILPAINLTGVAELFRPDRIAQVINATEAYGTPVMDRFYPENRRQYWGDVLVPRNKITDIVRAVPVVLRAAPGISLGGGSGTFEYLVPQPIKTRDAITAAEYNNAALAGMESLQQWANSRTARHLQTHRLTTEALAAQSLTGTITFPIANEAGVVVDTYTVGYGTNGTYTVTVDFTASATKISDIHKNLVAMRRQLTRAGYGASLQVLVGENIYAALLDKVIAVSNDTRIPARLQEDGGIRIGQFVLYPFDAEYYHPGGLGGSPAAGYTKVIGNDELMMYDAGAPWTFLRVKLDNFKLPADPAPLGVIPSVSEDGSSLSLYAESKPFPIPVPEAVIRTDATATS